MFEMSPSFSDIKTDAFHKAVKDCDKCLETEPNNLKALLRKGQALQGLDQRRDVSYKSHNC